MRAAALFLLHMGLNSAAVALPIEDRRRLCQNPLPPAEESPERFEEAARERKRFLRPVRRLLCERPLRPAVHLAGGVWHLIDRQINIVSRTRRAAAGGGKLVGNRTDRRVLQCHGGLQRFGGIMLCRFIHHLCPHRQCQRSAVTVRNNRGRLIEPDPHATRQRGGVSNKPRVFVIVSRAGLAFRRLFEAERARARGSALG